MKFLIVFIVTLTIIVSVFFSAIFTPYFIYLKSISKGFSSSLVTMKPNSPAFILKGEFKDKKFRDFLPENVKNWKVFHFSNYEIPLPVENPSVQLYPRIESEGKIDIFGGHLNNSKGENYFSFLSGKDFEFVYPFDKQKVFSLPYFKNFIQTIPPEKMFKLIFTKDLEIKNLDTSKKIQLLRKLWAIPYMELVLNLFILQIRNDIFPKEIIKFSWNEQRKTGVIELPDENPNYYKETIFMLEKDRILTFNWRLQKKGLQSDNIRNRFLSTLKYNKSSPDASIDSYNEYRGLSFKKKLSSTGFTILYSGLSHKPDDLKFLTSMVRDLRKRKENEIYLKPLYSYGLKKFNIDLSIDQDEIQRLRKEKERAEKVEAELIEASKVKFRSPFGDDYDEDITKEEKIENFLKDAKEKGEDLEENEGVMIEN